MEEAVIVAYGRSAVGRSIKGTLANTHPVDFGAQVLKGVLEKVPQLDLKEIDDVIVGCAKPEGVQGKNMARIICQAAGLPDEVSGQTVNRFCASGLQTVATGANIIMVGQADVIVAGGIESMSMLPMIAEPSIEEQKVKASGSKVYISMGETAENVANRYKVSRSAQDEFALRSQLRAAKAQEEGRFDKEIIPVKYLDEKGNERVFYIDECIRPDSNLEVMGKLKTVFKEEGTVTAANSSVTSDGAGFVVLMSKTKAKSLGINPIAKFNAFTVTGVDPAEMGIGPIYAIPKLMELTGEDINDYDVIELNEAFASQAVLCINELKLDQDKVNPRGGAIAMGHPLGATGTILLSKALSYLQDSGGKKALISMCIGGGMGAAGTIEMF